MLAADGAEVMASVMGKAMPAVAQMRIQRKGIRFLLAIRFPLGTGPMEFRGVRRRGTS
ncbi:hypothetical protein SY2F82_07880 [Streptomyces sp. Y2F8-2]|nr:hypothetical protein SY2F82_07880 [Streptomyces sp. Y2F8-2]